MSQSCRHDVFDPTSTIRLRSDSEGVFVRCAECNKAQHWTADYDDDTEPTAGPTAVERAVCPHGSLRRQCEVCERDEEIARLAKKLRIAELKASGTLATNLCPDHRDKQLGKPCLACEIERLGAERDKWQARAMALFWTGGDADGVTCADIRKATDGYNEWLKRSHAPDELDRLRAELKAATESEYAFCVERDQLRAEVERLTADLASAHEQLADQTARWAAVVNERDALRARIDALMLEYCPDEMTADQTAEWARHQVPHQLSAAEREALERESAAVDAVATEPKRAYYETREPPHCPTCGCGGAAAKREARERAPAAEES